MQRVAHVFRWSCVLWNGTRGLSATCALMAHAPLASAAPSPAQVTATQASQQATAVQAAAVDTATVPADRAPPVQVVPEQPIAIRPEFVSKIAQLQLAVRPQELHVEPVTPTQKPPAVSASPAGGTMIAVRAGEQLVIHEAKPATATATKPIALGQNVKALLPSTLVVGVQDPKKGTTTARQFQPFLSALVSPLRWDSALRCYATTVVVGLDALGGGAEDVRVKLTAPIRFQLSAENVDKVDPPIVDVSEAGALGYQRFTVFTKQFEKPIRVTAHSSFGDDLYEANIDPGPAFIKLGQSVASVDGFGLGKATISVSQRAANNQLLPASTTLRVHLKTSEGFLDPPYVDLPANSTVGETSLISSTWGQATVSETSAEVADPGNVTVRFNFPVLKFGLGLLGAACAGVLRVFTGRRERRQRRGAVFVGCIASGITIDILVALGAPIAPDWLLGMVRSELAWFAIGLIAGYPGVALVSSLGEKLFDHRKEEPASSSA